MSLHSNFKVYMDTRRMVVAKDLLGTTLLMGRI